MTSYRIFVEAETFNEGLKETFRGIANIFDALGVERASDALSQMSEKIDREKPASTKETEKSAPLYIPKKAVKPDPVDTPDDTEKPANAPAPKEAESVEAPSEKKVTIEDITKVIVTKIRMDRRNNQKIEELLKKYGVAKVSKLSEKQMPDFLADVSAI